MKFIKGKLLSSLLEKNLHLSDKVTILHIGNPLHFRMLDNEFYIYLKCISYAGYPYPENTTRAQLPKQAIFDTIKDSNACFMFWGYDMDNKLYVCWDPHKTKNRLNAKTYVSFFSRKNIQESVKDSEVQLAQLTNGDTYALFKEVDAIYFLEHLNDYFPQTIQTKKIMNPTDISLFQNTEEGKLSSVRYDTSVKLLVDEMLYADNQVPVLTILSKCMAEFGENYHKMSLKDWYAIINTYMKEFKSEQQSEDDEDIQGNNTYELLPPNDIDEKVSEPEPEVNIKERIIDAKTVPFVNIRQTQDLKSGWTTDVLKCVEQIPNDVFRLEDVYAFADVLQTKYPNNTTIKASIRHNLQVLRDKGYIEFISNGKYRRLNEKSFLHYSERIINLKQAKIRGEVIVAKPVLMLALIEGIDKGVFGSNRFILNKWLEERYNKLMKQYTKDSQFDTPSPISNPFWHLSTDEFWHLQLREMHEDAEYVREHIEEALECAEESEAWAVGQRSGVDVDETDPTYQNNSKYYAWRAGNHAEIAEGYAGDAAESAEQAAAFVGAPLVANTASAMTDKTRIYVYVGSQTGYTAGNWYYWNGSAWTSGGVYNSIADDIASNSDIDSQLYS